MRALLADVEAARGRGSGSAGCAAGGVVFVAESFCFEAIDLLQRW